MSCTTNDETTESQPHAEDHVVPLNHQLGAMLYADAIESLRAAEQELGIFISQSLTLKSLLKKKVDPEAPAPDWLQ